MDTIKISIDSTDLSYALGKGEFEDLVNIFINGRNLIDIIREVELTFPECKNHPFIAGTYIGVHMPWFWKFYLQGYRGGKVLLLQCWNFDDFGCWPILAKVSVEDDTVIWSDFEKPDRSLTSPGGHWVYNLKFTFGRKQYEAELSKCEIKFNE